MSAWHKWEQLHRAHPGNLYVWMQRPMIVYRVRHHGTGRTYIGCTSRGLHLRWSEHRNAAKARACGHLYDSMRLHGPKAFAISPIASFTGKYAQRDAFAFESAQQRTLDTFWPNGFNKRRHVPVIGQPAPQSPDGEAEHG